ncbi:hypothetical protein EVAR_49591_1 [Eumeta japonica]|uniref:Uncharacterized protein n=1 Tax=Eumeta variegata TaxID=151549 RepID=A0A4C1ZT07_EUMVA|nr:hypothetical protein EVAR_49591_1 [Eumeta japonica]
MTSYECTDVQDNARNSAVMKLVTKASQWRKMRTRKRRTSSAFSDSSAKDRGGLNLRIAPFAGNSERRNFVLNLKNVLPYIRNPKPRPRNWHPFTDSPPSIESQHYSNFMDLRDMEGDEPFKCITYMHSSVKSPHLVMMHVVMRLRTYEAALAHDDARRCEVLHPVAPLQLVAHSDLRVHLVAHYTTRL